MIRDGDPPPRALFVGRESELATIAAAAHDASQGTTRVLWIEGDGGTGKTTLVRRAVAMLAGRFTLVQSAADELSGDISYSTVAQLGVRETSSPFAAGLALVERLGAAQESGPVAVVVEDLHWADVASRGALLVALRQLRHDEALVLLTSRPSDGDDEWPRFVSDPDRCTRLTLGALAIVDIQAMAAQAGVELSRVHADRLHRHTLGHPLHVRTLLQELTPEQLRVAGDDLPAPRSLAASTTASLAGMPPPAQQLASALAVFGRATPLASVADVAGVTDASHALEPLVASGLVAWEPAAAQIPIEYTHPLYRQAVYADIAPERRTQLHLACADVTGWGTSWAHRIAAATGPDGGLCDELTAGAEYEVDRRDLSLAATYLEWAATVAADDRRAGELLLRSARLLVHDGQTARAAALVERSRSLATPGALTELVCGMLAFALADAEEAESHFRAVDQVEAADESNRRWRAEAQSELGSLCSLAGRADEQVQCARAALALGIEPRGRAELSTWWTLTIGEATLRSPRVGLAVLSDRLTGVAAAVSGDDAELLVARGLLHVCAGETLAAIEDLGTALELARVGFGFGQLPRAHLMLSRALYWRGDWDEALLHGRVATTLMDERPWMVTQAEAAMALVHAARGDFETAERAAVEASAVSARLRTVESVTAAASASAALAHARDDHPSVVAALRPIAEGTATIGDASRLTAMAWLPMLTVSLIAVRDLDSAGRLIDRLAALEDPSEVVTTHLHSLRARLAAASARTDDAAHGFTTAVESLSPDHPVLDRALLHHDLGRFLRTHGERRPGEEHLRRSHALLAALGANPYAARVEDELRIAGTADRPRRVQNPFELTTRERDVALVVKKGHTNKEVGAELYISAKSVEFHLSNVFSKLGIASRRELRDLDV